MNFILRYVFEKFVYMLLKNDSVYAGNYNYTAQN